MNETHEQCAQLLAVEGVLLLCNVHLNLSGRNVIQQHSYQLEQEPGRWEGRQISCENGKEKRQSSGCKQSSDQVEASLNPQVRRILKFETVDACTNLAKVSSGRAFCASPLGSW